MFTFDTYKKEIQKHYKIALKKDTSGILAQPTPAQLREYCKIILKERLTTVDIQNFKDFFETIHTESLSRAIDACNNDKFKTIISFLKATRDSHINLRVEIAAILIDYPYRPYAKFRKINRLESIQQEPGLAFNKHQPQGLLDTTHPTVTQVKPPTFQNSMQQNISKWIMGTVAVVGLGVGVQKALEPKCMIWKKNHYEKVDCNCQQQGLYTTQSVKPINESEIKLRKIETCDTTTFFDAYNKPLVWYYKINNTVECFNQDAKHPITGKDLKPITKYMIKTHKLDK